MRTMKLFKSRKSEGGDEGAANRSALNSLREEARALDGQLGAVIHARSSVGLLSSKEQSAQQALAKFSLYATDDLSAEGAAIADGRCASDEAAASEAVDAEQRRMQANAAASAAAQDRIAALRRSVDLRSAARSSEDATAADEESAARLELEGVALDDVDTEKAAAARSRYQRARVQAEQRRAAHDAETVVIEAIERKIAAEEAELAELQAEGVRISQALADHARTVAAVRWDAAVNRLIPTLLAMWETGAGHLMADELRLPFHDPRRVFAAGLFEGGVVRFDALQRLSAASLREALARAKAVLERSRSEVEVARAEAADRAAEIVAERASRNAPAHRWEVMPAVTVRSEEA